MWNINAHLFDVLSYQSVCMQHYMKKQIQNGKKAKTVFGNIIFITYNYIHYRPNDDYYLSLLHIIIINMILNTEAESASVCVEKAWFKAWPW